ncbi:MAG: alanine--tRNA ligase [Gammaproteobacteria bacterium]|jgi:alanyl-tRNA synthetase|nr:alanine--tRNA ligase [Gammaproteobacteria bacterium]
MSISSAELRSRFLSYFQKHGHQVVPGSSLVPVGDATLLFTNAGMVQFKDVFLGREQRPYVRAASSQRCVRAGGKHNDLDNVGFTVRHHTFFEMLGNFSFGDYFKREAIAYAWEFLTRDLGLAPERLWVTVHASDSEAGDIWLKEVGVDPARFVRIDSDDNFWSMGDTGPCGPCSEIFYDHGPDVAGGPPGSPDADGDRYVEIWNLVFMQYNRDAQGRLTPLPHPSVDTGMGLERLAAVMQGVHSNYDIDLFRALIRATMELAGTDDDSQPSLRVIADHIRSCAFLIVDGVIPSNEGRGYVLRRIIRRAIRHGYELGIADPFFHRLVGPLCEEMGAAYPELVQAREQVERVLRQEEERFAETLDQGMKMLKESIASLPVGERTLPGEIVFRLYDTYGFPVDLTADYAQNYDIALDMEGYEREMAAQRERARAAGHFQADYGSRIGDGADTEFTGYEHLRQRATVQALGRDGDEAGELHEGDEGIVVLDTTPFYAEGGGQVGDRGEILGADARFEVRDTRKLPGGAYAHVGRVTRGVFRIGDAAEARVDEALRQATALNHSATHLLHAALRQVLGEHVQQKGSLVDPERLRFDFSHFEAITPEQLATIEALVNQEIRRNEPVVTEIMNFEAARGAGAMALFGEKYSDTVRVLSIGEFSKELCGGTHVRRAGDIGLLRIVGESGIAAGVRRIEAMTGAGALAWIAANERQLDSAAALLKGSRGEVLPRVQQMLERLRQLEKEVERLQGMRASAAGSDLAGRAVEIAGCRVLAESLDDADPKVLRDMVDQLKNKLGSAVIVLATVKDGRVSLVAGVTRDLTERVSAAELANHVAGPLGGKGGGRADMAQAGASDAAALPQALGTVADWVRARLA